MKIAILDLYEGTANMGMKCIQDLIAQFGQDNNEFTEIQIFDVRSKAEVPSLDFDVYISSGGPGSPLDSEGSEWESLYFGLMDQLLYHNQVCEEEERKFVFLICHSFQLFSRYYGFAEVGLRHKPSFGIYPVHKTEAGEQEPFFGELNNPFWIADFRHYQVVQPKQSTFERFGSDILALEKERPHVSHERAIMAIRFTPEIFGTQFHPEADADGMLYWFENAEKRAQLIDEHGEDKYNEMIDHLQDPDKIAMTQRTIIPNFLNFALGQTTTISI